MLMLGGAALLQGGSVCDQSAIQLTLVPAGRTPAGPERAAPPGGHEAAARGRLVSLGARCTCWVRRALLTSTAVLSGLGWVGAGCAHVCLVERAGRPFARQPQRDLQSTPRAQRSGLHACPSAGGLLSSARERWRRQMVVRGPAKVSGEGGERGRLRLQKRAEVGTATLLLAGPRFSGFPATCGTHSPLVVMPLSGR
jgi:hypothetical protein